MSQLNVDNIRNRTGSNGGPNFPSGITVAVGQTAYIHGNLQVDGTETIINTETLNVADKTVGIGSTSNASNTTADGAGIEIFASSSQADNNKTLIWNSTENSWQFGPNDVGLKIGIGVTIYGDTGHGETGIVSATSFKGDGSQLTGIDATSIQTGNTSVQTIDTGSDGHVKMTTEGGERVRVGPAGQIGLGGANYGTSGQVITSAGSGSAPTWSAIPAGGNTIELVADGAIAAGKPIIIKSDGKVAQVGESSQPLNETISNNAELNTAAAAGNEHFGIAWAANRDAVVYSYRNSNGGVGVRVIKWDTAIGSNGVTDHGETLLLLNNHNGMNTNCVYDPDTDQVIVAFRQGSNALLQVMAVAANYSITATGSNSEWETGSSPQEVYMEYNTSQDKVIIVYRKSNQLWAKAATVSGDTIGGYGTAVQLSGATLSTNYSFNTCWDSTNNKVIVAYSDDGDNNKLKAVALDCYGTTLTWGTPITLYSSITTRYVRVTFDSDLGKAVVTNQDYTSGTSNNMNGMITPIYISSGTTIVSPGTGEYMNSTMTGISGGTYVHLKGHECTYDPVSKYFYIIGSYTNGPSPNDRPFSYQFKLNDSTNAVVKNTTYIRIFDGTTVSDHGWNAAMVPMGNYGKVVSVLRRLNADPRLYSSNTVSTQTNLTDRNCIGFAKNAISDGSTGSIATNGNVVDNQSGLTPGTIYFVQVDGTLSTTMGGTTQANLMAIASNKGLVQTRVAWT